MGKLPATGAALVLAACAASAPPPVVPAPPPRAEIRVSSASCPDASDAEAKLMAVLVDHDAVASALVIDVSAQASDAAGSELQLLVLRASGEVGLDRRYTLRAGDCESAPALLALAVDRFLSSFPEWAAPAPRPEAPPPPPRRARPVALSVTSAVHGVWSPTGVDAQLGVLADTPAFGTHVGGSVLVRATLPQAAGSGQFQQTSLLAGVAWRERRGPWEVRAEVRGGALAVSGFGFDDNHTAWLPWWEGAVSGGRTFRWGTAGLELAGTALRHRAITADLLVSEDIPPLRFGLAVTFGVKP